MTAAAPRPAEVSNKQVVTAEVKPEAAIEIKPPAAAPGIIPAVGVKAPPNPVPAAIVAIPPTNDAHEKPKITHDSIAEAGKLSAPKNVVVLNGPVTTESDDHEENEHDEKPDAESEVDDKSLENEQPDKDDARVVDGSGSGESEQDADDDREAADANEVEEAEADGSGNKNVPKPDEQVVKAEVKKD